MTNSKRGYVLEGVKPYRLFPSVRFGFALMLMFANMTSNLCFFSMSFSLTCMVNTTAEDADGTFGNKSGKSQSGVDVGCKTDHTSHESNGYTGTFKWSEMQQSFVLSGLGWGATATIFLSGLLVDKFGAKIFYVSGFFTLGITTLLIPFSSHMSWMGPFVLRIIQGTVQVIGFPCMLIFSNTWFPIPERGTLMAMSLAGSSLGGLIIFAIGGFFCRSSVGWEGLLYLVGSIAILCSLTFLVFYTEDVTSLRFITRQEATYIKRTRGPSRRLGGSKIPWRKLLTSVPVWGYAQICFTQYYLYYYVADYMPKFYKEVLGLPVQNSGILSAVPLLVQFVGRFIAGPISDLLERYFSPTVSIKIMTVLSGHVPAIFLVAASFFGCNNPYGAVALIALSYFFFGFIIGGFLKSASYMAPPYAGTISGIAQEMNYVSNVAVPYITAAMLPSHSTKEWDFTFYVAGIICFIGATIFLFMGSGELQLWAQQEDANMRASVISAGGYAGNGNNRKRRLSIIPRESVYSEIAFP